MSRADDDHRNQSCTLLLATDSANSVLIEISADRLNPGAYSAYGERSARQGFATHLGFNGEMVESNIGWYLLGNGYRAYNPRLMRFHSPDSKSPFGEGGLNAYTYCAGDPVNYSDPTGHMFRSSMLPKVKTPIQSPASKSRPLIDGTRAPIAGAKAPDSSPKSSVPTIASSSPKTTSPASGRPLDGKITKQFKENSIKQYTTEISRLEEELSQAINGLKIEEKNKSSGLIKDPTYTQKKLKLYNDKITNLERNINNTTRALAEIRDTRPI